MTRGELLKLAEQVLTIPTAPYHEHAIREFVIDFGTRHGFDVSSDAVGNVIVRYQSGRKTPPLVLMAHMDHPGFESLGGRQAEFLGGVTRSMFAGSRIRFYTANGPVRARITQLVASQWPAKKIVELEDGAGLTPGDFGMWDLPLFRVRGKRLHATAIDDVMSVVVTLATLLTAKQRKMQTQLWGVFTRAEEVGFAGALVMARSRVIPRRALVVSMEMSKERPWARMGQGPVVRIGDKVSVFNGDGGYFLTEVARQLQQRDGRYQFQRALMDGGTCEATVFAMLKYPAIGLCLPLGNYHNIGPSGRPQTEYVDSGDLVGLLRLTCHAAEQWPEFPAILKRRELQLMRIARQAPRRLTAIPT